MSTAEVNVEKEDKDSPESVPIKDVRVRLSPTSKPFHPRVNLVQSDSDESGDESDAAPQRQFLVPCQVIQTPMGPMFQPAAGGPSFGSAESGWTYQPVMYNSSFPSPNSFNPSQRLSNTSSMYGSEYARKSRTRPSAEVKRAKREAKRTVFIANLPKTVSEDDVREKMSVFGGIQRVVWADHVDGLGLKDTRCCFIRFEAAPQAQLACSTGLAGGGRIISRNDLLSVMPELFQRVELLLADPAVRVDNVQNPKAPSFLPKKDATNFIQKKGHDAVSPPNGLYQVPSSDDAASPQSMTQTPCSSPEITSFFGNKQTQAKSPEESPPVRPRSAQGWSKNYMQGKMPGEPDLINTDGRRSLPNFSFTPNPSNRDSSVYTRSEFKKQIFGTPVTSSPEFSPSKPAKFVRGINVAVNRPPGSYKNVDPAIVQEHYLHFMKSMGLSPGTRPPPAASPAGSQVQRQMYARECFERAMYDRYMYEKWRRKMASYNPAHRQMRQSPRGPPYSHPPSPERYARMSPEQYARMSPRYRLTPEQYARMSPRSFTPPGHSPNFSPRGMAPRMSPPSSNDSDRRNMRAYMEMVRQQDQYNHRNFARLQDRDSPMEFRNSPNMSPGPETPSSSFQAENRGANSMQSRNAQSPRSRVPPNMFSRQMMREAKYSKFNIKERLENIDSKASSPKSTVSDSKLVHLQGDVGQLAESPRGHKITRSMVFSPTKKILPAPAGFEDLIHPDDPEEVRSLKRELQKVKELTAKLKLQDSKNEKSKSERGEKPGNADKMEKGTYLEEHGGRINARVADSVFDEPPPLPVSAPSSIRILKRTAPKNDTGPAT